MSGIDTDIAAHLEYLRVERRVAARTLQLYGQALARLQRAAELVGVELRRAEVQHVRRWAAQLHGEGLAPRSIAIALSAWRGFYRRLANEGVIVANPVTVIRLHGYCRVCKRGFFPLGTNASAPRTLPKSQVAQSTQ